MEILTNFGVQWNLLLAQIVNFLIIFFVLKKFFYKPIAKALDDRKQKIAEGLKNAETVEKRLAETEEKTAKLISDARREAQTIIDSAKKESVELNSQARNDTQKMIEGMLEKAHAQIELERETMKKDLEKQTIALVVSVTQKVLARTLAQSEKDSLTKNALQEVGTQLQ